MSQTTALTPRTGTESPGRVRASGRLPRWAPPAVFAGALAVAALIGVWARLNLALYVLLSLVLGTVGL